MLTTTKLHRRLDELESFLGKDIFDRQVRPSLQPEHDGKFVATLMSAPGDYEIDGDDYAAVTRLQSRKPDADIWLMRAGYPVQLTGIGVGRAMIQGVVNACAARQWCVCGCKCGPGGVELEVDAIVDSWFSLASLTLPVTIVTALGLVRQSGSKSAVLADGLVHRQFDIVRAEVSWDGTWRGILVSAIGNEPLMGMRASGGTQAGDRSVVQGGLVEIVPFP